MAVSFGTQRLTYLELNRRANRLAHHLRGLGVDSEQLVGLYAERSVEALVGLLAVLKAGAAYVPMDPAYPRERVALMLEDAGVSVLLTQAGLLHSLPRHGATVVLLDEDGDTVARCSGENLSEEVEPDQLAYVIYTSGSTGRPKGVQVTHRGVSNLALAQRARFDVGPGSRVLQFASLAFDASVWEILMALTRGATLVMGTRAAMMPGPALAELLRAEEITAALFMASVLAALPEGVEASLPALRTLLVGGEVCHGEMAARWAKRRHLFNAYGPTEASCVTTMAECDGSGGDPAIGIAIPNAATFVLDDALRPVRQGMPGELYIGGPGVARGYLGRPGLTASRFIPDPFSAEGGGRLYRTGDLVRQTHDGSLHFLGRVDHQVKIRGHRIELEEIEAVLARHPAVKAAAVVVGSSGARRDRLVAHVVARVERGRTGREHVLPDTHAEALDRHRKLVEEWRRFLGERLPEPMVPSVFMVQDALPFTAGGKVDRAALALIDVARWDEHGGEGLPRNDVEATLAAVWAEALGVERVRVGDDVFELGAHSLLIAKVLPRLRRALGVEIPLSRLFEARSVAELARTLVGVPVGGTTGTTVPIQRAKREAPLPLSHGQRQIWLHAMMNKGAVFYNEPFTLRLPGVLDTAALRRALDEVVRRHESWRTTFTSLSGEPVQRIGSPFPVPLSVVDLSGLAGEMRWERALELATDEARRPFELEQGPLFRALLVRLGQAEHVLFMTVHHLVIDGISLAEVLPRELWALYRVFATGEPSPLPEIEIQCADVAQWQREQQGTASLARQLDYWTRTLADLPTTVLPTDRPRPALASPRGARHCLALSADLSLRLGEVARREGVTLFVVLLAAFKALLQGYVYQDEVVVGTSMAGRSRPEMAGLLGYFLNTVVLRTDMRGNPTFRELLDRVRGVCLGAMEHQDMPFEMLVEALQPRRVAGQNPLFQVAFILEPPTPALESGWTLSQLDVDTGAAKFDLTLELDQRPEGIVGRFEYSLDLFDDATIRRMAMHYETLLDRMSRAVDRRLSDVPFLTRAEQQVLRAWCSSPPRDDVHDCIHQVFEEQAARTPDAIAVIRDGGADGVNSITYAELNRRANQLARHLLRFGIAPEARVGICMYRSVEMVIALLGVLKAGLAFVPLDPSYPTGRLDFMREHASVEFVLTQSHLGAALPGAHKGVLCIDTDWHELAGERGDNPCIDVSASQLAYVMYTSGSTGQPKGVAVPHRGVVRLVRDVDYAHFTSEDAVLQLASISFDVAQLEVWSALLNGGKLVLLPPLPASLMDIGKAIQAHGVTTLFMVASAFHVLVDEQISHLRGLRQVIVGGEPLSPSHANRVLAEVPSCILVNAYGPTEATSTASCFQVLQPVQQSVPIGVPIPDTRVHVLDAHLREVPVGVPGELYIGGGGLARCYLGRPDLTAQRFVPDPTGEGKGGCLYRTGDRVRWAPEGRLEFLGRLDHQVKVRGYRVELGEIEAVLSGHPSVREVLVVSRPDRSGNLTLVAYVTSRSGEEVHEGIGRVLLDHLQTRLPDHMIPSSIVPLKAFPLTANGKMNHHALPEPELSRAERDPSAPPRSLLEERLATLWQEVLGLQRVGVHDNFFDLGGHSLLLMRLHERVREQLHRDITILDMFVRPTISALASFLASSREEGSLADADVRALKQRDTLKRKKLAAQAKSKQHGSA
ncbi:non-ribosomal peptide synthetase [Chondromyces crocatus]|uniref:non-ribosomal peptide synthetase n=1 Tax=Chondromyces crocatus TaxID=52 RepID=UPI001C54C078